MKSHTKFILVGGLALLLITTAGTVIFFAARKKPELSAEQHFVRGQALLEKMNYVQAFQHFLKAAEKKQGHTDYHWAVAKWAVHLGYENHARKHADIAWSLGMRTVELMFIRVDLVEADNTRKLSYALELLAELPESDNHERLRGDIYFRFNQVNEGLAIYEKLYTDHPSPELASKIAFAYGRLGKMEEALEFLSSIRQSELLNSDGYHILVTLLTYRRDFQEIEKVMTEAKERNCYELVLQLRHGILKLVLNQHDKALGLIKDFLKKYSMNSEITENSDVPLQTRTMLRHNARIYIAFVNAIKKKKEDIQLLKNFLGKDEDTRLKEGETLFYDYLLLSNRKNDEIPEELVKAKKLLPPHPIIELFMMAEANRINNYNEALESYKELITHDRLSAYIPLAILEYAVALAGTGQIVDSISVLTDLHAQRNIYSKRSVELLRTYTNLANMPSTSWKLQEFLFEQFGDDIEVQFSGGQLALNLGKWDKAMEIFANLASKYPEEARFKLAGIEVLLKKGDYEAVLEACKITDIPKEVSATLQALAHTRLKQFKEAEAAFEMAMTRNSDEVIQVEYAILLFQLNKLQRSRELLEGVLKRNPQNKHAQLGTAFISFRDGNFEAARSVLTPLISEGEDIPLARLVMAEIDLAENNPEIALSRCRHILQTDPEMPGALFMEGVCLRRLNRYNEAEKVLERSRKTAPDDALVLLELALTKQGLKKYDEALALIDRQVQKNVENEHLRQLRFNLLCLLKRFAEAEHELIRLKPVISSVDFTRNSAWLLEQQGRNKEAIEILARNLSEQSLAVYWTKLNMTVGQTSNIIPYLEKHELNIDRWIELGHFAVTKNLSELAVKCYRKAIESGSNDPIVLNNFAWYALKNKSDNKNEVLSVAKKAYELRPVNTQIMDTYATALNRFGRYDECISFLEKKRKIIEYNSNLLLHLAKAYEGSGNLSKALDKYNQILQTRWGKEVNFDRKILQDHVRNLKRKM